MSEQPNKQIAKNTIMLYIRTLLIMAVSLYTIRIVLKTLGIEDYGIYNVVGGVVVALSVINASLSGASSRFIAFAIGKKDSELLKKYFSAIKIDTLASCRHHIIDRRNFGPVGCDFPISNPGRTFIGSRSLLSI